MKTKTILLAGMALASVSSAFADQLDRFGAYTGNFNDPIWFNQTISVGSQIAASGTAPNNYGMSAGIQVLTLNSDLSAFTSGASSELRMNNGGDQLIVNSGANATFRFIEADNFNDGFVNVTINGGTFSFNRFNTASDKLAGLTVNGGNVTFNSVANDSGSHMDGGITFNLAAATVTALSDFNLGSASDINFTLANGFTPISAGGGFVNLNDASIEITLSSNPGWTTGQSFVLIDSSNGGNNITGAISRSFLGGFGGTYTLSKNGDNDIIMTINSSVIPEPTTAILLGIGGLALFVRRRGLRSA